MKIEFGNDNPKTCIACQRMDPTPNERSCSSCLQMMLCCTHMACIKLGTRLPLHCDFKIFIHFKSFEVS